MLRHVTGPLIYQLHAERYWELIQLQALEESLAETPVEPPTSIRSASFAGSVTDSFDYGTTERKALSQFLLAKYGLSAARDKEWEQNRAARMRELYLIKMMKG